MAGWVTAMVAQTTVSASLPSPLAQWAVAWKGGMTIGHMGVRQGVPCVWLESSQGSPDEQGVGPHVSARV